MLQIEHTLISLDIIEKQFCCNLQSCKGQCCIDGDAGAPLNDDEVDILEKIYPKIKPFVTTAGQESIEKNGIVVIDEDGDKVTPLINGKECAFTVMKNGIAYCAIEQAYNKKAIKFQKPISCHLYPIRIKEFNEFTAVNYHQWSICESAKTCGNINGITLYEFLKEPLIRKFGKQWYKQLAIAAKKLEVKKI
jgi:hypothetical protein